MSGVNLEIKGRVAKLLASEDIDIVHDSKCETASFNVVSRTLTLPIWSNASSEIYDMLIAHEVGHALFTVKDEYLNRSESDTTHSFINIIEDVRVEKLMKRKFSGLPKVFFLGYKQLSERDFFGVQSKDISKMIFVDRINIYYKIGNFVSVSFNEIEKEILKQIDNLETFEDTIRLADIVYQYCKNVEPTTKYDSISSNSNKKSNKTEKDITIEYSDNNIVTSEYSDEMTKAENNNGEDKEDDSRCAPGKNSIENSEPIPVTDKILENEIKSLIDQNLSETVYITFPKYEARDYILSYDVVSENFKYTFSDKNYDLCISRSHSPVYKNDLVSLINEFAQEYEEFKKSISSDVSSLVKKFDAKKSADAYYRTTYAKTGILNCDKLHSYMYNEDIFSKVGVVQDSQSHGLIFILDWSCSMKNNLIPTIKQLYCLVWFCKNANIPFDVYIFTNNKYFSSREETDRYFSNQKQPGCFVFEKGFELSHVLTSSTSRKEFDEQMKRFYMLAKHCSSNSRVNLNSRYTLCGTPLNETLLLLYKLIPQFKDKYKVQKIHTIILTDGEGSQLRYCTHHNRYRTIQCFDGYYFSRNAKSLSEYFLKNKITSNVYHIPYAQWGTGTTQVLLKDLKNTFPYTNFIGFRIVQNFNDVPDVINSVYSDNVFCKNKLLQAKADWIKNENVLIFTDTSYTLLFVLPSKYLNTDVSSIVYEDPNVKKIRKKFLQKSKLKKMNRKILNEFINCIA